MYKYKISHFWYAVLIGLAVIYVYLYKYKIINKQESFTPKINGFCRPHIRNIRLNYEHFINNYGNDFIINKFKKWNIY
jgi:hypothetical protein